MGWIGRLFSKKERKVPERIDEEAFEERVLRSDLPVILDLWSPGCPPCQQLEAVMVSLATDYDSRVRVCEMNAASAPSITSALRVRATPTVLYFNGGEVVERITGFRGSLYHQQTIQEVFGLPHRAVGIPKAR